MSRTGTTAIQGEEGSFSAAAARALLGDDVRLLPCASFASAFAHLDDRAADCAVLPIENSTAGLVQPVWDRLLGLLPGPPLAAHAEARVPIAFVAACLPGARDDVRHLLAHPVAEAQCGVFVERERAARRERGQTLSVIPAHDTAGAARLVAEGGDRALAALCPAHAATPYGLEVFATGCGDAARTVTRFLLVERGDAHPRADDDRTLLSLQLRDAPGALIEALTAFAARSLNLCALHSRPVPGQPGRYAFLVELETGGGDATLEAALAELRTRSAHGRVVGSFRAPPWPAGEEPSVSSPVH